MLGQMSWASFACAFIALAMRQRGGRRNLADILRGLSSFVACDTLQCSTTPLGKL